MCMCMLCSVRASKKYQIALLQTDKLMQKPNEGPKRSENTKRRKNGITVGKNLIKYNIEYNKNALNMH